MKWNAIVGGTVGEAYSSSLEIQQLGDNRYQVADVERSVDVTVLDRGVYSIILDGRSYEASVREEKKGFVVEIGAHLIPVRLVDPSESKKELISPLQGVVTISSPMPGRVVGIKVTEGGEVKEGEGVMVVEAMKMENELHSPKSGKVTKIIVNLGDAVEAGQDLVTIE